MSIKKIVLGLLVLIVAAVAVLAVVGLQNLDEIIKRTVESVGTETTKTQVTLQSAKVSLRSGRGELHQLQINNPSGYSSDYAFLLEQIALEVDPASLLEKVIVIKEIKVDGAKLIAQHKGLQDLNLVELAKTVKEAAPESSADTSTNNDPKVKTDVRLMIEKITLSNNHLRLISEKLGEKTLTLPTISLTNIGDKQTGLAPHELAKAIMKPLLAQAAKAVKSQLKALVKEQGKDKLKDLVNEKLGEENKKKVDKLKSLFGK
jgi:uncharacterized protein involved in outer membrane biogenesis